MYTNFIITLFTAISFIIYGITSFFSEKTIKEYARWGYKNNRKLIGFFQFIGGIGLIIGVKYSVILSITSFFFIIMMFFAVFVRIKIKDNIINILPTITYLILNITILYNSLQWFEFNGAWSVYPYFKSDNIIISDINSGLFIVKKQN